MITADLISYIKKQQDNNISRDLILVKLATAGWHIEDINEGFDKVAEIRERENRLFSENDNKEAESREEADYQSMSLADRYREPIDLDAEPLAKKEIPTGVKKKEITEPKKDDSISFANNNIGLEQGFKFQGFEDKQVGEVEISKDEIVSNKEEESKIELEPLSETEEIKSIAELVEMPSEINNFIPVSNNNVENLNSIVESKNMVIEPAISSNVEPIQESNTENIPEVKTGPLVEEITTPEDSLLEKETGLVLEKTQEDKELENKNPIVEKQEDSLIEPVLDANEILAPKDVSNVWLPKNIPVKEIEAPDEEEENDIVVQNPELPETTQSKLIEKEEEFKSYKLETLPKIAPMATYPKDVITALNEIEKEKNNAPVKKFVNKRLLKLIAIILGVLLLAGGLTWAIATNKIDLKNINIPFINKDPRSLILNNSKILNSLSYYKTETTLEIATPSFADISAGLLTGEAVSSLDKDNIILNSTSTVARKENRLTSDTVIAVKGSIFQDVVNARIHNDGEYLYLNFPDLSNILKESAPLFGSVKISEQEFYLVPSLFGPNTEKVLNKLDLYKLLSGGMSSYVDQETLGDYDSLIQKVQITKKGQESIKGVETNHFSINPDKELFKNLLTKITERFSNDLSETDKGGAGLLIGSASVSSFDVWVGRGDNTIYQYNIVFEIPMTKILGFEDKSVGNNTMSVSLKVTYFDFNKEEGILIPTDYTEIEEFVKNTKIENVKNKVKEFANLANNLQKIEKKFGTKSNAKGSCMSPVSGSLFSPIGHPKTAVLPVSEISSFLNYTLDLTKGMGSCYSTTTDWSFAIPLVDNYDNIATSESYDTFYCIDSKGADIEISALPSGVTCEQKTELKKQTTGV
jgi:hypothetical protein